VISSLTALLVVLAAVIGSTAMVGVLAYLLHRIRQIESGATDKAGSRGLSDRVEGMQEEFLALQKEMSALQERLDFTEKLLMSGDDAGVSDDTD
jgi:hypothetical protein